MVTETEVKFVNVNIDEVRKKLQEIGAVCEHPMVLMKRVIIDYPDERLQKSDAYIRVRDEGERISLTYKKFDSLEVGGAKEIETTVDSFDDTVKIFEASGLAVRSLQESKRETWKFENVEIVLDKWPWLNPYIEIEGESVDELKKAAKKLGYRWENAISGDVMAAYRVQYPHLKDDESVGSLKEVRFGAPLPEILKSQVV